MRKNSYSYYRNIKDVKQRRIFSYVAFCLLFFMTSFSIPLLKAQAVEPYKAPKISNNKPIRATANEIIIERSLNRATLLKNAKIVQKPITLKAEKIIIDYLEKKLKQEEGQSRLKEMKAYKDVEFITDTMYVTSDEGVYNAQNSILILSGNVVVIEGNTKAQGDKFIYNVATGESKIESALQIEDSSDILKDGKDGRVIIILEEERIENQTNQNNAD